MASTSPILSLSFSSDAEAPAAVPAPMAVTISFATDICEAVPTLFHPLSGRFGDAEARRVLADIALRGSAAVREHDAYLERHRATVIVCEEAAFISYWHTIELPLLPGSAERLAARSAAERDADRAAHRERCLRACAAQQLREADALAAYVAVHGHPPSPPCGCGHDAAEDAESAAVTI